MHNHNTCI